MDKNERFLQQTRVELATASRILAHHGIVDAFGHVSVRDPSAPTTQFLLSRNLAPALVTQHDIVTYSIETAEPLGPLPPKGFVERHIHAQLYRKFSPDQLQAVVHCHAPELLPFGIAPAGVLPLLPVYHMAAFLGKESPPVYDNASFFGTATDLLIRTEQQGDMLASFFEQPDPITPNPSSAIRPLVLMRGHGATLTAPSLRVAVYRAIYSVLNARVLVTTRTLLAPPDIENIQYLNEGECSDRASGTESQVDRAWAVWTKEVGPF